MTDILYAMRADGATIEEMARAVSEERNRLRIASYADDPDGLEKLKQSNLENYGHEEGPTPDELFEKYGSWQMVLQKSFSTNMGMDACCGLYDEYYQLYIELGYVEAAKDEEAQPDAPDTDVLANEYVRKSLSREGYELAQVVVLSRHNIRAPLSGAGSALDTITPHTWFDWSAEASQLSVRGGTLETEMGQYFRKWLEAEGLFEPNYRPADGVVRLYANSKQRTIATAQYFATGLLPVANIDIEYHAEFDTMDSVFNPVFTYVSDAYAEDALEEINEMYGDTLESLTDNYALLFDVIDAEDSEDYKNGTFSGFQTDDSVFSIEEGKEPGVAGSLKRACQVSDALVLQYFEESDAREAAFGHDISNADWEAISEIKDVYGDVLFTAPSIAVNVAHPLLEEMRNEITEDDRKFTFLCGHDSNLASVLAALEVEDYSLPGTIEKKTPIGGKLVISEWIGEAGEKMITLDLVYQTTEQLREMSLLGEDDPPVIYSLRLKGLTAEENGMYPSADVMQRLEEAIEAYYELQESYELQDAA